MSFANCKVIKDKKETNTSALLVSEATENHEFLPSPPLQNAGFKVANVKNDKERSSSIQNKSGDIFKEKNVVSSKGKNCKDILNKDAPNESKMPHSRTQEKEKNETPKPTIKRPVKDIDKSEIAKRRTLQSRSNINHKSYPNSQSSTQINDKDTSKTKVHHLKHVHENKSEPSLQQSPTKIDYKSTSKLKIHQQSSKIKPDESKLSTSQPSNRFDNKDIMKTKGHHQQRSKIKSEESKLGISQPSETLSNRNTNQSKASEQKIKYKPNILKSSKTSVDKNVSKTKTHQSKANVKENKFEPNITLSPTTLNTTDTFETKSVLLMANVKKDKTETRFSGPSKAIDIGILRKKTQQSEVKSKDKRFTSRYRPQLKTEIDDKLNYRIQSEVEVEDSGRSPGASKQRISTSKDKNIKSSFELLHFMESKERSENCSNNISIESNKSDTGKRHSVSTTCSSVAKLKSSSPSQLKVIKTTVRNPDNFSVSLSTTIKENNVERMEENLSAQKEITSSKTVKQAFPSKKEEKMSNRMHRKITLNRTESPSEENTSKQLSEVDNVVDLKYESQEFSKTMLHIGKIPGNIQELSVPDKNENDTLEYENRPIANVTIEKTNHDENASQNDKGYKCILEDVCNSVAEASLPLSEDASDSKDTAANGFSFKSTDKKLMESITRPFSANVIHECQIDDDVELSAAIVEFNNITREGEKGNKGSHEEQNNDISNMFQDSIRMSHKLAWDHETHIYKEKKSDFERHGHKLKKSKSALQDNWIVKNKEGIDGTRTDKEEINGARPKTKTFVQLGKYSKHNQFHNTEMTFLKILLNKESIVIVEELLKHPSLLDNYTEIATMDDSLIDLFLQVLLKAFKANSYEINLQLFEYLKTSGFFDKIYDYLLHVIIQIKTKQTVGKYVQRIVENLLNIQIVYLDRNPSTFSTFRKPHVIIGSVIEEFVNIGNLDDALSAKHQRLTERLKVIEKNRKKVSLQQTDICKPDDDFRHYSIVPTVDEITGIVEPFLRPIKATGCYENLHDYLDVNFRLLREDFVGPLREGITGFIKIMSAYKGKARTSENLKDLGIKIYENVRVLSPVVTQQGLCYKMKLKMTANLKNVEWDVSKRLIYGSMVCLTDRDFTEFIMATVVEREVKDIRRGYFVLHFETQAGSTKSLLNRIFIMAETSGYFEAYRHVLFSLQTIKDGDLPFEKYIVSCEKSIGYPNYLEQSMTYDLRPLVDQNVKLKAIRYLSDEIKIDLARNVEFSLNSYLAKDVHVTDHKEWPSKELLRMNESQYKAVQSALTREFTIIQGPPGTGKTYIGLQIVKTLLHNKSHWTRTGITSGQMLIVCYTNHALDQFMEGIVKFYEGDILRVGGRSNSTELEEINLKKYRKMHFKKGTTLARLQYEKRDARRSMELQSLCVQELAERIQVYQSEIVDENALSAEIGDRLFDSLTNDYKGKKKQSNFSLIVKWLGIEQMKNECKKEIRNGKSKQKAKYVKVEDETSRTIKDRMIDTDEDFHFSSNKRSIISKIRRQDIAFYVRDPNASSNKKGKVCLQELIHAKRFYKTFRAALISKITDEDCMSQGEADTIQNVWRLNHQTKWRLYRLWIKNKCAEMHAKIEEKKANFEAASKEYRDASLRVDKAIMQKAVVIGMTTSGAAKYQSILRKIGPRIIVVEEAAEVLEAHIITTLSRNCEHLILIGDHKQLRPNPTVYKLVVKYNLDISLFERMVKNDIDFDCLELQHRMRPEIANIMRHIYPELKDHEDVKSYPNVKGVSTNLFLINHSHLEACSDEIKSFSNHKEAEYSVALCRYLLLQGYERKEITILTTYTGQLIYLRKLMPKEEFDGVHATVVDNYQGEENKIVILSLVRSNTNAKIGFLKTENRICVALSRAKVGLFIIGNFDHLASHSSLWERITKDMKNKGYIGEGLVLYCQNHPNDNAIVARNSEDFLKAPDGGCLKKCETRLECGHKCVRYCHVTDQEHKETKCKKPCIKILCEFGHKCPDKCFVECSPCSVLMIKVIPNCGHTQAVPCAMQPEEFCCQEPCSKLLECGHSCKRKCGEAHTQKCYDKVYHTWPCGHSSQIMCWESKSKLCPRPCGIELKCKHTCSGTCGSCFMGRVHQQCRYESSDAQLCGHMSSFICQHDLPCSQPCKNRCSHKKCSKTCGELCTPCYLPCSWQCMHKRCTKRCGEICNRTPCNFPCEKILKCKHICIGLCGEPCPNICRVCNTKKFKAMTFGKKHEKNDKYVYLEQCGHLVKFRSMDAFVNSLGNTKPLCCPKCNTNVNHCLRYGNTIKAFMKKIESTKEDDSGNLSLYSGLKSSICIINFKNLSDSTTYAEIKQGKISTEDAKKKFPTFFYKDLCKKELGNRLDNLYESRLLLRQQLQTVEKQWTITNEIVDLIKRILDMEHEINEPEHDRSLVSFLHQLIVIVLQSRDILTDQENEDFKLEIQRGKAYLKFLKTKKLTLSVDVIAKLRDDLKTIETVLLGSSRFTSEVEKNINGSIECLGKEIEVYM